MRVDIYTTHIMSVLLRSWLVLLLEIKDDLCILERTES